METVNDLVAAAIGDLRTHRSGGMADYSVPEYPACVFYYGKRSAGFHPDVLRGVRDGWGGSVEAIPFLGIDDPGQLHSALQESGTPFTDLCDGNATHLGVADLQGRVMNMMSQSGMFANMNQCSIYCVLDSTGLSPEEFRKWYVAIEDIRTAFTGVSVNTMLMVLLNNDLGTANASQITSELRALYDSDEVGSAGRHLYGSVLVYGNKSRRGYTKLFAGFSEQAHNERDLLSDVMLLSNSHNDYLDLATSGKVLYAPDRPAITAAFKYVDRPRRDIVAVALKIMLGRLGAMLSDARFTTPGRDEINAALGVKDGKSSVVEELRREFAETISKFDGFEKYLPSLQPGANIADMPYGQALEATGGCLKAFLEQNQYRLLERYLGKSGAGDIDTRIEQQITANLNAAQLSSLNDQQIEQIVSDALSNAALSDATIMQRPVRDAVYQLYTQSIVNQVRSHTVQVLRRLRDQAESTLNTFDSIQHDVAFAASIKQDGAHMNVEGFYTKCVESFFNDVNIRTTLFTELLRVGNTETDMLRILREHALQPLFASVYGGKHVFELGFMDEAVERLADGKSAEAADLVVGKELTEDVGDRMGYSSMMLREPDRVMEAYMLHIDSTVGSASHKLYSYLDNFVRLPGVSRVYYNAGQRDSATSVWLYPLDADQLSAE